MIILIFLLYSFFVGMSFFQAHLMSTAPHPLFAMGLRMICAACFGFATQLVQRKSLYIHNLSREEAKIIFLQGLSFSGNSLSLCITTWHYLQKTQASFIFYIAPFITALILYVQGRQKLKGIQVLGLIIGFVALVPMLLFHNHSSIDAQFYQSFFQWGALVYLGGVILYSYRWIFAQELLLIAPRISPTLSGAYAKIGGGIIFLGVHFFLRRVFIPSGLPKDFWMELFLYSLLTWIGYRLYMYLLKFYSPTFLSFAGFLQPVFIMLCDIAGHAYAMNFILMAACVLLSISLYVFGIYDKVVIKK